MLSTLSVNTTRFVVCCDEQSAEMCGARTESTELINGLRRAHVCVCDAANLGCRGCWRHTSPSWAPDVGGPICDDAAGAPSRAAASRRLPISLARRTASRSSASRAFSRAARRDACSLREAWCRSQDDTCAGGAENCQGRGDLRQHITCYAHSRVHPGAHDIRTEEGLSRGGQQTRRGHGSKAGHKSVRVGTQPHVQELVRRSMAT